MSNLLLIFVFYLQTCLIEVAVAQIIRTDCSFLSTIYSSESAVENQFQLNNATSISLAASYAFASSRFLSRFELGLIYRSPSNDYLVPFPIRFNCTSIIHSCQLRSMTSSNLPSINSEPIRVQLTPINYTTVRTSLQWQQMGLYLKQGRYQLSNCTLDDEQTITHPRTLFFIDIQYEKSIGSSCNPLTDTCGPSSLARCSTRFSTCDCLSSSFVTITNLSYCADSLNSSNCQIFPSRCVDWCNATRNVYCICPSETWKIQRNDSFVCELAAYARNCSINDSLRRCSLGQCCIQGNCLDCSNESSTIVLTISENSDDERLRIGLGVTAGSLGLLAIGLLIVLFCIHRRRKQRDFKREKSISDNTTTSSTSSIYISPIHHIGRYPSSFSNIDQYSHHSIGNLNDSEKRITRTDSFYRAILSESGGTTEHVSTKRDSLVSQRNLFFTDQIYQISNLSHEV